MVRCPTAYPIPDLLFDTSIFLDSNKQRRSCYYQWWCYYSQAYGCTSSCSKDGKWGYGYATWWILTRVPYSLLICLQHRMWKQVMVLLQLSFCAVQCFLLPKRCWTKASNRKDVEQVNWHCYHNLRYPSYHYCRIIPACCTKVCRILDRDGNCYWLIRSWITSSCCIYFIEFQGLYQSRSEVELIHECTVWLMIFFSDRFPIFILARSYCCWCCYSCDWSCYCRQRQHQRYPCCQEGWRYYRWYRAGGWSCAQSERCQKCWWSNSSWKSQDWFDPVPIVATKAWCKCGMD